jgi:hypothetical protein
MTFYGVKYTYALQQNTLTIWIKDSIESFQTSRDQIEENLRIPVEIHISLGTELEFSIKMKLTENQSLRFQSQFQIIFFFFFI